PLLYDHGFIEGNGAQFTWFVPHNLPALFELMGGADTAAARLNRQFELTRVFRFCNEHPEEEPVTGQKYVNNCRTWINYSNQPSSQAAFIFNYAGQSWLTQKWSRAVVDSVFSGLSPYSGYQGDEDQGLMGSLAVLMKIGLFQMNGGCEEDPAYEIGSPIFDEVTIHLNPVYYKAKTVSIKMLGNGPKSPYIQAATLNGKPLSTWYIRHSNIKAGANIKLKMGKEPCKECWKPLLGKPKKAASTW
ncbi:MAG: glycoside hydrolase family 92 protein, partial [Bacteroidota bacterium]|nr:glycoside hydrolase family 92 protein [Bacteroidota bacterium]